MKPLKAVQRPWNTINSIFHKLYFPELMYSTWPAFLKSPAKAIFTTLVYGISLWLADVITSLFVPLVWNSFGSITAATFVRDMVFVSVTLITLYLLKPETYPSSFLRGFRYFFISGIFFGMVPVLASQLPEWTSNRPNFMWNPDEGLLNIFWMFLSLLIAAAYEEAMFRGGFDAIFRMAFGKYIGSILQIGFFVAVHGVIDVNRAIQLAMAGLIFTLLRHSRYGITASIGAHAAGNCLATLLFGSSSTMRSIVPDYPLTGILTISADSSYMALTYVIAAALTAIWLWRDARAQRMAS
jgi:membrane protease YdiL (CAAX protease family)